MSAFPSEHFGPSTASPAISRAPAAIALFATATPSVHDFPPRYRTARDGLVIGRPTLVR